MDGRSPANACVGGVNEITDIGRLKANTALHLKDSFIEYGRSLELDDDMLNDLEVLMGAKIDVELEQ